MMKLIAIALMLAVTACATPDGQNSAEAEKRRSAVIESTVKLATVNVIHNSSKIDKEDVLSRVAFARDIIENDTGVTLELLTGKIRETINWGDLKPMERILVDALIADVKYAVPVNLDIALDAEQKARVLHVLGLIEQGAAYAD